MVKNVIKVFARLKKETKTKKSNQESYVISKSKSECEDLILHRCNIDFNKYSYHKFRYQKIFDQESSQNDIFDHVAKPVVSSVIHGFNGTIFAYGQTGSGKTYSITGCPKVYDNRGIIPRSIEHIFDYLNQNPDLYTVHLSYLEIYNEIGYDLLNPKQIASKLEEYPRVLLLEDGKGEAHLRNLSIHPVCTEKEAMRLLFLGDTNRTIAETPMNEYSSRSHCIFTIYLNSRLKNNGKNVKSKLHIVDLAGSERIHKTNITGTLLHEAKTINLSLHYLEQVILALSSSKRGHIPYRNSMLTYLLKDSLSGNSLTTMLATLAVTKKNIEETISTCRFSMRVSLVAIDPTINEEDLDSQQEINILHNEINELKTKLLKYENNSLNTTIEVDEKPDNERKAYCKKLMDEFLRFKMEPNDLSVAELKCCMEILRDLYLNHQKENAIDEIQELKTILKQKDDEISTMKDLLEVQVNSRSTKNEVIPEIKINPRDALVSSTTQQTVFKTPRWKYEEEIKEYNKKLEEKYQEAKTRVEIIEQYIAKHLLNEELYQQQDIYRKTILALRELEKETNHLKLGLLQVEMKMKKQYEDNFCDITEGHRNLQPQPKVDHQHFFKNYNKAERDCEIKSFIPYHEKKMELSPGSFLQSLINQDDTFGEEHFGLANSDVKYFDSFKPKLEGSEKREVMSPPCHDFSDFWNDESLMVLSPRDYGGIDVCPRKEEVETNNDKGGGICNNILYEPPTALAALHKNTDSEEFKEFMKSIPLTGDEEVDDEIFSFYRSKFVNRK